MHSGDRRDQHTLPTKSEHEREVRKRLIQLLSSTPIPPEELLDNLTLYLRQPLLMDLLSINELYGMAMDIPGVFMEFGVYRGRHLATLTALRGIYEPHNIHRRIVGFDTFTGLANVTEVDTVSPSAYDGRFALPDDYPIHLREVLDAHEDHEHLNHVQRTLIVQGDVHETLPKYLEENPHTIIAFAYFDMDICAPTAETLQLIRPYLTKGSIIAFDELAHAKWPGETVALRETLGLDYGRLHLLPGRATPAYLRWGE